MPLTDTDINPGQHNKMKKVLFCLFFALVVPFYDRLTLSS